MEGFEYQQQEIAARLDRSTEAIRLRRTGGKKAFIDAIADTVHACITEKLKLKIEALEAKARINQKSYRVVEKTLDEALKDDTTEIKPTHLGAANVALDRTEGKPLDRKAILSQHTEVTRTEISVDGDALDAIVAAAGQINEIRRKALPAIAGAEEAETLEPLN